LRPALAKSVVSKRIGNLEKQLGAELLPRSMRGVVPTDKRIAFHKRTREIMQQLDRAVDEIMDRGDDLCRQVCIAAFMSFVILISRVAAVYVPNSPAAARDCN
jgi:DNA-binding transcriptional LysR family regulator